MTPSPARAAANAANAQRSTGPRTAAGKARSAQNARKQGLTARELIVHDDERGEFGELQRCLLAEIDPQGTLESIALRQLLHAAWNLQRFRRLEAALFFDGIDPVQNEATFAAVDRLSRYAARAERSYYRALQELRTLKAQRRPTRPGDTPKKTAELAYVQAPRQNEATAVSPAPSTSVARTAPALRFAMGKHR